MKILGRVAAIGLIAMLGACSSIVEGTSQDISVNTDPQGARCEFKRQGESIGLVDPTPGEVTVDKTKHDIVVTCEKEGYQQASYLNKSDVAGATVGNAIAGGLIGWGIDSATGADNKYESSVFLELQP